MNNEILSMEKGTKIMKKVIKEGIVPKQTKRKRIQSKY